MIGKILWTNTNSKFKALNANIRIRILNETFPKYFNVEAWKKLYRTWILMYRWNRVKVFSCMSVDDAFYCLINNKKCSASEKGHPSFIQGFIRK